MSFLSHRERIRLTLAGEKTDRAATGEFLITDEFTRDFLRLDSTTHIGYAERRQVVEQLDLDIAPVSFSAGWGAPVQPDENRALEELVLWSNAGDRFTCALIDGPFSAAARSRGFNILLRYTVSAPAAARESFREGAAETRVVARAVRDAGGDAVILGEDLAYNRSPYLSPEHLRELYLPELSSVARDIQGMGLAVFFHSDGNLVTILDDLAACSLDGLQGLEPEAGMSIDLVRRRIGPGLTLWGNLGFDFLHAEREPSEITKALQTLAEANSTPGKLIIGSSPGLVHGLNVETVRRVYRTLSEG